jgi:hypothetical protein
MEAEPDDGGVRPDDEGVRDWFGLWALVDSSEYPKTARKFVSLDATPQAGTPTA